MQRIHFSAESCTVDKTSNPASISPLSKSKPETVNRFAAQRQRRTAKQSLRVTVQGHFSYLQSYCVLNNLFFNHLSVSPEVFESRSALNSYCCFFMCSVKHIYTVKSGCGQCGKINYKVAEAKLVMINSWLIIS